MNAHTSLFRPAARQAATLKAAFMGFPGSGKTTLATRTAIGLVERMREMKLPAGDKPVYFVDTENGSDYVLELFDDAGIEVRVAKTRAFADLLSAIREAETNGSVLIIDSISHFWEEWVDSYTRQKGRKRGLEMFDWGAVKEAWRRQFTQPYLNANLHIVFCARAGFEYDTTKDEDTGKTEIEKTGIKMQAEKNLGYEASLFVLVERIQELHPREGQARIRHVAHVFKDRFPGCLDGQSFEDPVFSNFRPHIDRLNMGGDQGRIDVSRNSASLVASEERRDYNQVQREICLDEIQAVLVEKYPSTGAEDKKAKAALVKQFFGTTSWTEIEKLMPLDDLRTNYDALHRNLINGEPSRYSSRAGKPVTGPVDEIPFLTDQPAEIATEKPQICSVAAGTQTHATVTADSPAPATEQISKPVAASEPNPAPEPMAVISRSLGTNAAKKVPRMREPEASAPDTPRDIAKAILERIKKTYNTTRLSEAMKAARQHYDDLSEDEIASIENACTARKIQIAGLAKTH